MESVIDNITQPGETMSVKTAVPDFQTFSSQFYSQSYLANPLNPISNPTITQFSYNNKYDVNIRGGYVGEDVQRVHVTDVSPFQSFARRM